MFVQLCFKKGNYRTINIQGHSGNYIIMENVNIINKMVLVIALSTKGQSYGPAQEKLLCFSVTSHYFPLQTILSCSSYVWPRSTRGSLRWTTHLFSNGCQNNDDRTVPVPHHAPEVLFCRLQWILGHNKLIWLFVALKGFSINATTMKSNQDKINYTISPQKP